MRLKDPSETSYFVHISAISSSVDKTLTKANSRHLKHRWLNGRLVVISVLNRAVDRQGAVHHSELGKGHYEAEQLIDSQWAGGRKAFRFQGFVIMVARKNLF